MLFSERKWLIYVVFADLYSEIAVQAMDAYCYINRIKTRYKIAVFGC